MMSPRSLLLLLLLVSCCCNLSSSFQYDWWTQLSSNSSQESNQLTKEKGPTTHIVVVPVTANPIRTNKQRFWSTSWKPMLTPDGVNFAEDETSINPKRPTPPPTTPVTPNDRTLEWEPASYPVESAFASPQDLDDFDAFAAKNTKSYVPVIKAVKVTSNLKKEKGNQQQKDKKGVTSEDRDVYFTDDVREKQQQVSWDDNLEFVPALKKNSFKTTTKLFVTSTPTTTAPPTTLRPERLTLEVTSSNSKATGTWSAKKADRLVNRFGTVRSFEGKGNDQTSRLRKQYEDAVADISSSGPLSEETESAFRDDDDSGGSIGDSGEDGIETPHQEIGRIQSKTTPRQTRANFAIKGKIQQQKQEKELEEINDPGTKSARQTGGVKTSAPIKEEVKSVEPDWKKARVTSFFTWEKQSDKLQSKTNAAQSLGGTKSPSRKLAQQRLVVTTTIPTTTTEVPTTTLAPFARIQGVKTLRIVRKMVMRTTTQEPEEEVEWTTTIPPPTGANLRKTYQQSARFATKGKVISAKLVAPRKSAAKSSTIVSSNGFGWTSNVEHEKDGNTDFKTSTYSPSIGDISENEEDDFPTTTTTTTPNLRQPAARFVSKTNRQSVKSSFTFSAQKTNDKLKSTTRYYVTTTPTTTPVPVTTQPTSQKPSGRLRGKTNSRQSFNKKSGVFYVDSNEREDDNQDDVRQVQVQNLQQKVEEEDVVQQQKLVQRSSQQKLPDGEVEGEGEGHPNCRLQDSIPGEPNTDYPTLSEIPVTSFRCEDQSLPGYYGDVEAQCQVFHVCQHDGRKNDFLCPVGTTFNQQLLVCDWWQNSRCGDTPNFFNVNAELYQPGITQPNNQLRKRTGLEREIEDNVESNEEAASFEEAGDEGEVEEPVNEEEESVYANDPPSGAIKGSSGKQRIEQQKQDQVEQPVKGGAIKVTGSYGARLVQKKRRGSTKSKEIQAAASSLTATTATFNNSTSPTITTQAITVTPSPPVMTTTIPSYSPPLLSATRIF